MPSPLLITALLLVVVAIVAVALLRARETCGRSLPLQLTRGAYEVEMRLTDGANPTLLLPFRIGTYESLFLLDTGYAGAPVLNTQMLPPGGHCSQEEAYVRMVNFSRRNRCIDYTSGCVLRLMGIGSSAESASDMLLCPPIEMRHSQSGRYGTAKAEGTLPPADVLMTNSVMSSTHILTLDYLRHLAPCLIRPAKGVLRLRLPLVETAARLPRFRTLTQEMHGGAFVCEVRVDGTPFRCTVDTGAGTTICLSRTRAQEVLHTLDRSMVAGNLRQVGINGEVVCSDLVVSHRVELGGARFSEVPIFLNSLDVEDTDGYVGLGLLRAFDLLVAPNELFAKRNTLHPKKAGEYADLLRAGECQPLFNTTE